MRSRPLASIWLMVRRNVDSQGTSAVIPSFANAAGVAAVAHSAMATNERAPAMTAHAAIARIPGSRCRSPRALRGSGTVFSAASNAAGAAGMSGNSSSSNWSTTVYVGDDDIGHGPSRCADGVRTFMIITRAMPTPQTAMYGVSRRIAAGQEIKAGLCRAVCHEH